jgi:hypothetical protein
MQESTVLLEHFINDLNMHMKTGDYFESIIQGCSMGEDIARLALLNMEKSTWHPAALPRTTTPD